MARKLPANLSHAQREALTQFFDGHLSAGQLSQRLTQAKVAEAPPPGDQPGIDQTTSRFRRSRSTPSV